VAVAPEPRAIIGPQLQTLVNGDRHGGAAGWVAGGQDRRPEALGVEATGVEVAGTGAGALGPSPMAGAVASKSRKINPPSAPQNNFRIILKFAELRRSLKKTIDIKED